jgi:hypothetical protein
MIIHGVHDMHVVCRVCRVVSALFFPRVTHLLVVHRYIVKYMLLFNSVSVSARHDDVGKSRRHLLWYLVSGRDMSATLVTVSNNHYQSMCGGAADQ